MADSLPRQGYSPLVIKYLSSANNSFYSIRAQLSLVSRSIYKREHGKTVFGLLFCSVFTFFLPFLALSYLLFSLDTPVRSEACRMCLGNLCQLPAKVSHIRVEIVSRDETI